MEAEKERMRALMHQSFLQHLSDNPLAAAMAASGGGGLQFPFGALPGMPSGPALAAALGMMDPAAEPSTSGGGKKDDEALNLSTKAKKVSVGAEPPATFLRQSRPGRSPNPPGPPAPPPPG